MKKPLTTLMTAGVSLALAATPAWASPARAQPSAPSPGPEAASLPWEPGLLTLTSAWALMPLLTLATGDTLVVTLAPLALSAGHVLAGDTARGLTFSVLTYPILAAGAGIPAAVAAATTKDGFGPWLLGGLTGAVTLAGYSLYVAHDANLTAAGRTDMRPLPPLRPYGAEGPRRVPRRGFGLAAFGLSEVGPTYWHTFGNGLGCRVSGAWMPFNAAPSLAVALTKDLSRGPQGALYGLMAASAGPAAAPGMVSRSARLGFSVSPGLGITSGPFYLEGSLALFYNGSVAYGPSGSAGILWWF